MCNRPILSWMICKIKVVRIEDHGGLLLLMQYFHRIGCGRRICSPSGGDLLNCETLCCQWRDILPSGTPRVELLSWNIKTLPLWQRAQQKLESNLLTLRMEQYRDANKDILQMNRNWRMGQFKKSVNSLNTVYAHEITMSEDYVLGIFITTETINFAENIRLWTWNSKKFLYHFI